MGIDIRLEIEDGEVIEEIFDSKNILRKLLPSPGSTLLSGVDPYGDTVFNRLQMKQFLSELRDKQSRFSDHDQLQLFSKIQDVAERCSREVHTYLRLIGD